jgi:hypothetical protein
VKERSILFKGEMVRAIREGRKTQTRRIVNPQPPETCPVFAGYTMDSTHTPDVGKFVWADSNSVLIKTTHRVACPHGQAGDRLWVREKFAPMKDGGAIYAADHEGWDVDWKWKPSIHMPRWASRINLDVTGVRVEKLQDISEADAVAEGIELISGAMNPRDYTGCWKDYTGKQAYWNSPIDSYHSLWESINGPGSWGLNSWVWVVGFKKVDA